VPYLRHDEFGPLCAKIRMDDLRRSLPKECHGRNVIDSVCLPLPISLSAAKQAFFSCCLSSVIFRPLCSFIQGRQSNQAP
jgi:hypothetical protein